MVGFEGWELMGVEWRKGPWTADEDQLLTDYVNFHGEGRWSSVASFSGLKRNGKSCRLRWVNYLRPGLKKGQLTSHEESIIIELQSILGNKWSTIARCLPGRTDNEIKNYWRTHMKNKEKSLNNIVRKLRIQTLKHQFKYQQRRQLQHHKKDQQIEPLPQPQRERIIDTKGTMGYEIELEDQTSYMQDMVPTLGHKYHAEPLMIHENGTSSLGRGEENLWGDLWNLDDFHVHFDHSSEMLNQTIS